ncbi:c-type cytochrome [Roseimaritima sediminicola]|uniref:c-type cytochrome n=1 Tax=Roseimaritima sediminicola TaxID=2662066 RepID=UPI00129857FB|nr:c-type cytochrome [Roseimaritima sediminicola]
MIVRVLLPWLLVLAAGSVPVFAQASDNQAPDPHPIVAGFDRFAGSDSLTDAQAGQLLIDQLNCAACHTPSTAPGGPDLHAAGLRLDADWVQQFIQSPQAVKPGTTMPDVMRHLTADKRAQAAEAIAAFLSTQRQAYPEIKATGVRPVPYRFWQRGDAARGAQLYHRVGCVACHRADPAHAAEGSTQSDDALAELLEQLDPEEIEALGLGGSGRSTAVVPHANLTEKYTALGLTRFLLDPLATRPAGRMPDMKLTPVEAADLAAYLLRRDAPPQQAAATAHEVSPGVAAAPEDLAEQGREWFTRLNCVQCHAATDTSPHREPVASPLTDFAASPDQPASAALTGTCVDAPSGKQPHYAFNDAQRRAIAAALKHATAATAPATDTLSADTRVHLRMVDLNCYACHERDSLGGVASDRRDFFATAGHVDLGDEGRLPPPLSGVGRKLTGSSIERMLSGKHPDVRPYMLARMPVYAATATEDLPELFAAADDARGESAEPGNAAEPVFGDVSKLAEAGRKLMDTGCVQCHPFGGLALPGVRGVDLAGVAARLRPEWFAEFVRDPGKLKPRTRMPTFFPDGNSQNPHVLEGDPRRQIAAMWAYLNRLDKMPVPEKVEAARSTDYELVPTTAPILLRTFMPTAGTHAIAVGFPAKVHLAYDADRCRPAVLWRNRFLDAQGTWFVRFAPPAEPLGDDLVTLDGDYPLVRITSSDTANEPLQPRFEGYALDDSGTPTFASRALGMRLQERWEPHDGGLLRILTVEAFAPQDDQLALCLHSAANITIDADKTARLPNGLQIHLLDAPTKPQLRTGQDGSQWLIPLRTAAADASPVTIRMHYTW